ncbi:hypothetical protein FNJ62_27400, partial [Streptomyces benahoarensis]
MTGLAAAALLVLTGFASIPALASSAAAAETHGTGHSTTHPTGHSVVHRTTHGSGHHRGYTTDHHSAHATSGHATAHATTDGAYASSGDTCAYAGTWPPSDVPAGFPMPPGWHFPCTKPPPAHPHEPA